MASSAGASRSARTGRYFNIERGKSINSQAWRWVCPHSIAKATWSRRACELTIFAVDLLQCLDRHLALGDHALELGVLSFQFAQSFHVCRLELSEPPSPDVDCLLTDFVFSRHVRDRTAIGLAQDSDHLLFGKSNFLHQLLASSAGAIVSSYDWSEKPGQVMPISSLSRK